MIAMVVILYFAALWIMGDEGQLEAYTIMELGIFTLLLAAAAALVAK